MNNIKIQQKQQNQLEREPKTSQIPVPFGAVLRLCDEFQLCERTISDTLSQTQEQLSTKNPRPQRHMAQPQPEEVFATKDDYFPWHCSLNFLHST